MFKLIKKPVFIVGLIIVSLAILGYVYFGRGKKSAYEFVIAKRGDIVQEVSLTGRVKSASSVDLAFEKGGRVLRAYISIGDKVGAGQTLVALDNTELAAQQQQAEANLESAKAKLQEVQVALEIQKIKLGELRRGTRKEEIQITETEVANARKTLADAGVNLENVGNKASVDLKEIYDGEP